MQAAAKLLRRRIRTAEGRFLAEGPNAVGAAIAAGRAVGVFVSRSDAHAQILDAADDAAVPVTVVDDRAMASLSDASTPSGLVAVCTPVSRAVADVCRGARTVAVLHEVRDPGNLGAVIRVADASGADAVVLLGDAVDAEHPKVVRATAGSLFSMPIGVDRDAAEGLAALRNAGLQIVATVVDAESGLFEADEKLRGPTAWVFGNEAHGLPEEVAEQADVRLRIPIRGGAESLNLATAAAVCLYTSARLADPGDAT